MDTLLGYHTEKARYCSYGYGLKMLSLALDTAGRLKSNTGGSLGLGIGGLQGVGMGIVLAFITPKCCIGSRMHIHDGSMSTPFETKW